MVPLLVRVPTEDLSEIKKPNAVRSPSSDEAEMVPLFVMVPIEEVSLIKIA